LIETEEYAFLFKTLSSPFQLQKNYFGLQSFYNL
jgi:hypothetical protein